MDETVLERAQAGDSDAFQQLIEPLRRELLMHCYRILGSLHDAEDILQETLLSAWRALGRFDGRSLRAWLYRIATNHCLNFLRDGSRRPQSVLLARPASFTEGLVSSNEPWWLEPCPDALLDDAAVGPEARYDARESVALSFVAGLQRLPAQQRAVLVLRDVLGFSAAETADLLDTTPTLVNSALARARAGFRPGRRPEQVPLPRSAAEAQTVERFVKAFQRGDPSEIAAVLTEDARLTMPPEPLECEGPGAIADFMHQAGFWGPKLKLVPTRANDQPAFGFYRPDPNSPLWRAAGLIVLSLCDDQVSGITRFDPALLARFGLPRTLPRERP
ncbi:MAG TPA: sigma-70 family RNA polymerase sigma factor [Streptosporangiaceae bacterium]